MILPSVLIILIIASILRTFIDNTYVQAALDGIRAAVCALMLSVIITLCKKNVSGWLTFLLCALAFIATFFFDVSSILVVIVGGILGLILFRGREEKKL